MSEITSRKDKVLIANGQGFWGDSILILEQHQALENAHHVPFWVKASPLVVGILGLGLSYLIYLRRGAAPPGLSPRSAASGATESARRGRPTFPACASPPLAS